MARIRTIKPEFWRHEELSELPESVHMLAAALLNYADDEGLFNANEKLVKAECSPLREPSVSTHDALILLSNIGYLKLGTGADGKRYGLVVNFLEHQRINRKTESKIKKIKIVWDDSVSPHPQLSEVVHREGKGKEQGKEGKGEETASAVSPEKYIFESGVIRLNANDMTKWKQSFSYLDLPAELIGLTQWAATQEKWFFAVSGALAKRNREAKLALERPSQSNQSFLPNGQLRPEGII